MSTATPARKPATGTASTPSSTLRKPASQTTPGRSTSPGKPGAAGSPQVLSGVARSPSTRAAAGVRAARAPAWRPGSVAGASGQSAADMGKEEDAKAENAALLDSLRESLRNAEILSEDYQKQLATSQARADELLQEHSKMEERLQESLEKNEELQTEKKEATRELREAGNIYESEKAAMMKDREESAIREEELRGTIQSLKDRLAGREAKSEEERAGRPPTRETPAEGEASFAPSIGMGKLSPQRSDSKSTSRLVMQKDQVIESLRLELAEAQIKLVEMENQGGGRMAELEKTLLETRMTNARLMEDNESYQLLLGEKTMNGELAKSDVLRHAHHGSVAGLGSLAEELQSAENNDEKVQKLHDRVKALEDEKKALTLYIDKMLTRIMGTSDQVALLNKDGTAAAGPSAATGGAQQQSHEPQGVAQNVMAGLSRSLSVFNKRQRPTSMLTVSSHASSASEDVQHQHQHQHQHPRPLPAPRSRPASGIIAPAPGSSSEGPPYHHHLSAHNNPLTAPSIPLGRSSSVQMRSRGHRRTQSSQSAISSDHPPGTMAPPPTNAAMQRQLSGSRSPGLEKLSVGGIDGHIGSGPSTPRSNSFFPPPGSSSSNTGPSAGGSIAEEAAGVVGGQQQPPHTGSTTSASASTSQRMSGGSGASFTSNENASIEQQQQQQQTSTMPNPASSPPRGSASSATGQQTGAGGAVGPGGASAPATNNYTGAVMTQNKLRPLRLVQQEQDERAAEEQARKKANRGSWMGWLNKGVGGVGGQQQPPNTINEQYNA